MAKYSLESFMTKKVLFVTPDESLKNITRLMSKKSLSSVLVVKDNKPVGIITERDIVKYLSSFLNSLNKTDATHHYPVATELMTHNPITANKSQTLQDSLIMCVVNNVRHLPVVNDDGDLCGIMTYTDIANELLEVNQRLQDLSLVDPLLEIGNRRAMELALKSTHELSRRYSHHYTVVMIDIDYFKKYNDHYGHQAGDKALQNVAACIKNSLRASDYVYRYGGEEFLVLLPQTEADGAKILAQRILDTVINGAIPHCESPFNTVTVSCGIACYDEDSKDGVSQWMQVVKHADEALYNSKSAGRNQLSLYLNIDKT
ncbi:MAG: GGDEF domain-containing protein [Gammaproteobacteria bacterium]|nr:GGDEF domain-containing protein [Gammaproteobacteria bacterium]